MSHRLERRTLTLPTRSWVVALARCKILHARNQHLRIHRGFSVAFPNRFSPALSNGISLISGIFKRIVTCPVDFTGIVQRTFSCIFKWTVPSAMSDFWRVVFCHGKKPSRPRPAPRLSMKHRSAPGYIYIYIYISPCPGYRASPLRGEAPREHRVARSRMRAAPPSSFN